MNTKQTIKMLLPILAAVGLTMSGAAFAGEPGMGGWGHPHGGPHGGPAHECMGQGDRMERLADELDLSEQQRQQIKKIQRQARAEMLEVRDAMHDNHEAMRGLDPAEKDFLQRADALAEEQGRLVARQIKLRNRVRAKVASVLTPEQREKAERMRKEHRHERGDRPRHGRNA